MKIRKSVLTLALAAATVFGIIAGASAADTLKTITAALNYGITIKYNGDVQEMKDEGGNTVYPISYEGTTYLPIRAVANMLGIEVNWDGPTNTVWLGEGFVPTPVQTAPAAEPDSNSNVSYNPARTPENNYGFNVLPGFHVEPGKNGHYILINDETGYSEVLAGDNSMLENGYVAGTGQIGSDAPSLPEGHSLVG